MRKLLPYENALIEALGITREEYFVFRKAQQEYKDPKIGTALDIRNGSEVAIVLAVVGMLFQVAAALLMPRPSIDIEGAESTQVSRRASPIGSFNTVQELANYGQSINLVYANRRTNKSGGARVNTQLVRSAVFSHGRNQYIQLLAVISAGEIGEIKEDITSFGQTLIKQLPYETVWIYRSQGRAPIFDDLILGSDDDPARKRHNEGSDVYGARLTLDWGNQRGFSQAFSPPSATEFGVTEAIPLGENVVIRNDKGKPEAYKLPNEGTRIDDDFFQIRFPQVDYSAGNDTAEAQDEDTVTNDALAQDEDDEDTAISAQDEDADTVISAQDEDDEWELRVGSPAKNDSANRRSNEISDALVQGLEIGTMYKFEATKAQLVNIRGGYDVTESEVFADFKRIPGYPAFKANYDKQYIAKIVEASYVTISPVNAVTFTIKARVYMNVQGRQKRYADTDAKEFDDSQNGDKYRLAMFVFRYRELGASDWRTIPGIFCIRRSSQAETHVNLSFYTPGPKRRWEFLFEPVAAPAAEIERQGGGKYHYLDSSGSTRASADREGEFVYWKQVIFAGKRLDPGPNNDPPINSSPPGIREWTLSSLRSDTVLRFSFESGPEFSIVSATEQQLQNYPLNMYKNMSMIGVNAYSGPALNSVRALSVFVEQGKKVREISDQGYSSTPDIYSNLAPEIFFDTLLDAENGIGQYINIDGIDVNRLFVAKLFCLKNKYYMDGVITGSQSWRQFWSQTAAFSLLELAKIGGKETLIPAVPFDRSGLKTRNVQISALFNQGNIIEGTYKEDFLDYGDNTQDLVITVVYRNQESIGSYINPYPKNDTVTIRLQDSNESTAMYRSFDLSNYVTRREQAIDYGKFLVQQQRNVRRAVQFQTFPTEAPIEPGSYIYVQVDDNNWDDIHSGQVLDDGSINIPFATEKVNGTYDTLIYVPGKEPEKFSVSYVNGQSLFFSDYAGTGALFVLGTKVSAKRVFRVIAVTMEEGGEVTISAAEHPCEEIGGQVLSKVAHFDDDLFRIS